MLLKMNLYLKYLDQCLNIGYTIAVLFDSVSLLNLFVTTVTCGSQPESDDVVRPAPCKTYFMLSKGRQVA